MRCQALAFYSVISNVTTPLHSLMMSYSKASSISRSVLLLLQHSLPTNSLSDCIHVACPDGVGVVRLAVNLTCEEYVGSVGRVGLWYERYRLTNRVKPVACRLSVRSRLCICGVCVVCDIYVEVRCLVWPCNYYTTGWADLSTRKWHSDWHKGRGVLSVCAWRSYGPRCVMYGRIGRA